MIMNDEGRVPTTDEMDETTPEDRYKLVAICDKCHEPHYFTGKHERFSQTSDEICKCGGRSFYGLQSQRTFDPTKKRAIPKNKRR